MGAGDRRGVAVMPHLQSQPALAITSREERDDIRLLVSGDLDRQSAWALTAAVIRAQSTPASRVVVDLHDLVFIDAGGLRALADVARRTRKQGRSFAVAAPSPPVARLLRLTGLDKSFDVV
jgi:anti-anti-sigma factor